MCNNSGIDFVRKVLNDTDVRGRRVLEMGSLNVNGSVRPVIECLGPREYIGVDLVKGDGVDRICRAEDLLTVFGPGSFGLLVSTEVMEHIRDWRLVISNMKALLEDGGGIILTTRSQGFAYHGYPHDFWRFEVEDMREIFSDMLITSLESDPLSPGVFLKAVKKPPFSEKNASGYELYSMVTQKRAAGITELDYQLFRLKRLPRKVLSAIIPDIVKRTVKRALRI